MSNLVKILVPTVPSKNSVKTSQLISRLNRFAKTPVLVVGDLMVDRYIRGQVNRLSPEAPVPVVHVRQEDFMPGGAGNVACNIAALGGVPHLVSVIGQDAEGDRLAALLRERGVEVDGMVKDDSRPTILKTRVMAGHQQVVRFDHESHQPLLREINAMVLRRVESLLPKVEGIIISDYGKGLVNAQLLPAILALARRHKKIVTVDPKVEHFLRYRGVHCITPNLKEATEGMRALPPKTDADVDELGRRILKRLRSHTVLITRGERGMSLYEASGRITHIPSQAQEVFDVTGAGDTVISTLTLALASGASWIEAAQLSNLAAGVVVAKLGTATAKPAEIRAAMAHWQR